MFKRHHFLIAALFFNGFFLAQTLPQTVKCEFPEECSTEEAKGEPVSPGLVELMGNDEYAAMARSKRDNSQIENDIRNICMAVVKEYISEIPKGEKGDQGFPGVRGLQGRYGVGLMGSPGSTGPTDPMGISGMKGYKGEYGYPGRPGPMGLVMEQQKGARGPPGFDGLPGMKGYRGAPGFPGPKGNSGKEVFGTPGSKGEPGVCPVCSTESFDDGIPERLVESISSIE